MKSGLMKALSILLVLCMLIPMAACGVSDEKGDEKETKKSKDPAGTGENEEVVTERTPYVSEADYDAEFVALYCGDTFVNGSYFVDPDNREEGNDLDDKLYEREIQVEEYLGVDIIAENGGTFKEYTTPFSNAVLAGDDSYQMLMTHTYMGISNLITSGCLYDMNNLDSLNLDADYWNSQLMNDLAIGDRMFLGYNDFCLSQTYLVVFNKDMYAPYEPTTGNLYDCVRNKEWTLEKMTAVASLVSDSADNPDRKYGFSCYAWVPLSSFVTASDLKIADKDLDTGELYITAAEGSTEKLTDLHEKIYALCNAEYTYAWGPDGMKKPTEALKLPSNRVLMSLEGTFGLVSYKGEDIRTGILPYPKYDAAQENYQHLNWNGMLAVSSVIKNEKMVGDVMEMLAYYTTDVKTAFYETLLGSKVANAPEDAEMLELIWSTTVSDLGLVFSDLSANVDAMVYFIPQLVTVHDQSETASFLKSNAKAANKAFEKFYEKVEKLET